VGLVDLSASIVELVGLDVPAPFEGKSLAGLVRGDPESEPPVHVFMESGQHHGFPQLTIREGRWKLIHVLSPRERRLMAGSEYELYDVIADPRELHNRSAEEPAVVERLSKLLHAWYRSGPPTLASSEDDAVELDPNEEEMLRELGYVK
jgi:arylsulfatase A-like enzyme